MALCAAAGALLAAAAPVAADCASPRIAASPADGAAVPPDPTIHVFIPRYTADRDPAPRVQVSAERHVRF